MSQFNRRDSLKSLAALGAAGTLGGSARWRGRRSRSPSA